MLLLSSQRQTATGTGQVLTASPVKAFAAGKWNSRAPATAVEGT